MLHTPRETKIALEECRKPERNCKKKCPYYTKDVACLHNLRSDAIELIYTLENDNACLQKRIENQRFSTYKMQLMYDWALERLRSQQLNDRAHFQGWLREKGFQDGAVTEMLRHMSEYQPISFTR